MSRWLEFQDYGASASGKTRLWVVARKDSTAHLGEIRWYPGWRRYVFQPFHGTIYEQDCLRDIAAFCETQTTEHRAAKSRAAS